MLSVSFNRRISVLKVNLSLLILYGTFYAKNRLFYFLINYCLIIPLRQYLGNPRQQISGAILFEMLRPLLFRCHQMQFAVPIFQACCGIRPSQLSEFI